MVINVLTGVQVNRKGLEVLNIDDEESGKDLEECIIFLVFFFTFFRFQQYIENGYVLLVFY